MRVYGVGRLTKDVEIRMTTSGKKVASFSLACNRTKEITDFPQCVAWEKTAELLQAYTHKGSQIGVEGTLTTRSYDDPNFIGKKVYVTEVLVDRIKLLDSKPKEEKAEPRSFEELADYMESNGISHIQSADIDDDDLPF